MTKEDIVRMAKEAGFTTVIINEDMWYPFLKSFATIVVAHNPPSSFMSHQEGIEVGKSIERERCAKIALTGTGEPVQIRTLEILRKERERIAANILEIE